MLSKSYYGTELSIKFLAPCPVVHPGSHGGPPLFTTGMDVYVRKENAWFYGIIKKVDEYHKRCRVSFDGVDDVWASFKVLETHGHVRLSVCVRDCVCV